MVIQSTSRSVAKEDESSEGADQFDLTKLRLDQSFAETAGVKKLLTTVPVRKPNRQDFIRVHEGENYRMDAVYGATRYVSRSSRNSIRAIDWSQQEFGIAAALSGDQAMQEAYLSGDCYLHFAKQAGAVPEDATKHSHGPTRELFKACILGVQYGTEAQSLAARIGRPPIVARDLLRAHRDTYRTFWRWSDAALDYAMLRGSLYTVFGWHVRVGNNPNPRSLRNFPMQANGAETNEPYGAFANFHRTRTHVNRRSDLGSCAIPKCSVRDITITLALRVNCHVTLVALLILTLPPCEQALSTIISTYFKLVIARWRPAAQHGIFFKMRNRSLFCPKLHAAVSMATPGN